MINIVHIQTGVPTSGDSTFRLHKLLVKNSYKSKILSLESNKRSDDIISLNDFKKRIRVILSNGIEALLLKNLKPNVGTFSIPLVGSDISNRSELKEADIIFIYWAIGGFQSIGTIENILKLQKPVVIVMRDMWTITGGCHHSFSCDKYKSSCNNCPLFVNNKDWGLPAWQLNKKKSLFNKYDNVTFVSPSRWLSECGNDSIVTGSKVVRHIPNIIDTEIYKPISKKVARELIGLETTKKVIAFGAKGGTSNPYKGWQYLLESLKYLEDSYKSDELMVLLFGKGYDKEIDNSIPFECRFMGYLYDDYALSVTYNSIDLFITPSVADNLPSTVLESLACGVPVVGFDTGGIPEMIDHLENGYIAKYKDSKDLAEGIKYCLEDNLKGYLNTSHFPDRVFMQYKNLIDTLI